MALKIIFSYGYSIMRVNFNLLSDIFVKFTALLSSLDKGKTKQNSHIDFFAKRLISSIANYTESSKVW